MGQARRTSQRLAKRHLELQQEDNAITRVAQKRQKRNIVIGADKGLGHHVPDSRVEASSGDGSSAQDVDMLSEQITDYPLPTETIEIETNGPNKICFGVIFAEASFIDDGKYPRVHQNNVISLTARAGSRGVMNLYRPDSDEQLGAVTLPALPALVEKFSLEVTVYICAPAKKPPDSYHQYQHKYMYKLCNRVPARVVVHGCFLDKTAVGNGLSAAQIFLQHPNENECLPGVAYDNPHYFLRPGAAMPKLENLQISSTGRNAWQQQQQTHGNLDDADKSHLLSIFETAAHRLGSATGTPSLIAPSPRLTTKLKDHQIVALTFMVEKECGVAGSKARFPQLWEETKDSAGQIQYTHVITGKTQSECPTPIRGGILADEMGLGKTLSTLSLIAWHLDIHDKNTHKETATNPQPERHTPRTTVIITPKSTIHEWTQQIRRHIAPGKARLVIYHGTKSKRHQLSTQLSSADIVLTTYDTVRSESATTNDLPSSLTHPTRRWARIILDEAHTIRNRSSSVFATVTALSAPCRWCLTGTPIQNSLADFGSLLTFIRARPFDRPGDFAFWVVDPLMRDERGVGGMLRRRGGGGGEDGEGGEDHAIRRLRALIGGVCLRRTKRGIGEIEEEGRMRGDGSGCGGSSGQTRDLFLALPGKREVVEELELDDADREVYNFFKKNAAGVMASRTQATCSGTTEKGLAIGNGIRRNRNDALEEDRTRRDGGRSILPLIGILRLICNHGADLLPASARKAWREKDNTRVVDWEVMQTTDDQCQTCGRVRDGLLMDDGDIGAAAGLFQEVRRSCPSCANSGRNGSLLSPGITSSSGISKSGSPTPEPGATAKTPNYKPSAKVRVLLQNLEKEHRVTEGAKSVVFSYWARMLDLVEKAFTQNGVVFQRIDGQTTLEARIKALEEFDTNPSCRVMLATIGSMGVGVNLTVANSVHILEPHWNPMVEAQATDRVHRIGQRREVTVTRYFIKDSIEGYVKCIQNDKLGLINRSLSSGKQQAGGKETERHWKVLFELLQ